MCLAASLYEASSGHLWDLDSNSRRPSIPLVAHFKGHASTPLVNPELAPACMPLEAVHHLRPSWRLQGIGSNFFPLSIVGEEREKIKWFFMKGGDKNGGKERS